MTDYDTDFQRWCQDQADRLRRLEGTAVAKGLDIAHIAEEIEDLGKRESREAEQAAEEVVATELALAHRDGLPSNLIDYWTTRQGTARHWLARTLEDAPSVRQHIEAEIGEINGSGRDLAELLYYRAGLEPPVVAEPRFTLDDLLANLKSGRGDINPLGGCRPVSSHQRLERYFDLASGAHEESHPGEDE